MEFIFSRYGLYIYIWPDSLHLKTNTCNIDHSSRVYHLTHVPPNTCALLAFYFN